MIADIAAVVLVVLFVATLFVPALTIESLGLAMVVGTIALGKMRR